MDLTGERWKLGLLLHTHNEQKNRCTYNRCCMMNVSVMQRRFLFAAQVFVDDTQPILAAHWVYWIRYNKLRKLKIAEKVDTACRSLVE